MIVSITKAWTGWAKEYVCLETDF